MRVPKKVLLCEVGPRDGLQSLGKWIDTETKVAMVDRLSDAGFPVIEVTGFAHPRVIPALKDAEEVVARIRRRKGTVYRALVPNARGAERAAAAKVDEMLGLITVSETYLKHNQNMTREQAIEEGIRAFRIAEKAGIRFVMALGVSMWCAYEGKIPVEKSLSLLRRFRDAGMRRFYLAGSMGLEDPVQVFTTFSRVREAFPDCEFGYHVHNYAGWGTANVLMALDAGVSFIEGSICGIGGGIAMPRSVASVGNLPTEDLVVMFNEMGIETDIDTNAAVAAARDIAAMLGIEARSHAVQAGTREDVVEWGRKHPREHPV